ncbi:MAG: aminodeoxychorismate synthase, component I [Elusimicrobia bacterium RIFOXYA2_FULL_39_19]|nr:MAG: aminodeoxychorismate synthase, component I [Elusimicrobia bacterium RIFOXYA2_FULL_39_19]
MIVEKLPFKLTAFDIANCFKNDNNLIFLDSNTGTSETSRYSFIFADPFYRFSSSKKDAFTKLKHLLSKYKISQGNYDFPLGAAAGYVSYDAGRLTEHFKTTSTDELCWPYMEFGFYDTVLVYDNLKHTLCIVSTGLPENTPAKQKEKAKKRIELFFNRISKTPASAKSLEKPGLSGKITSNFTKNQYYSAINKIKKYIEQGDVYQVNLSQRFYTNNSTSPFQIYKTIREKNNVPFGAYLKFDNREILSFSMERFLSIKGSAVETKPIKGTMPRGKTPAEDAKIVKNLLTSKKNLAELLMITDLERNDLGKVCSYDSIRVAKLHEAHKYATVIHLISTITGTLHKNKTHLDCFKACFPGGSITGAPKIRSMEIIDELEGIHRNVYCGSIGYFGFNKVTDFNIAIRTIMAQNKKLYFNSGGGITYDSVPSAEYEETLHKVKTFLEAL